MTYFVFKTQPKFPTAAIMSYDAIAGSELEVGRRKHLGRLAHVLKDYPGSMSIGGNSIFDSSVNIDSQLSWQGFWFGEISNEVSRVEWKPPT
jgi:hypothetical protein